MNFKNVLYRLLGHLYAAESLILLNRAGEAIPHLNPDNISQISNFPPSDNQKPALAAHGALRGVAWLGVALSCLALPCLALPCVLRPFLSFSLIAAIYLISLASSPILPDWYPNTTQTAKVVLQYNLSAVYALRGEFEKAGELLRQVLPYTISNSISFRTKRQVLNPD